MQIGTIWKIVLHPATWTLFLKWEHLGCNISLCGLIGYLVNYGEAVYITCFLLAFVNGTRLSSVDKSKEELTLSYTEKSGWTSMSWDIDEYGEWESYTDDRRWFIIKE